MVTWPLERPIAGLRIGCLSLSIFYFFILRGIITDSEKSNKISDKFDKFPNQINISGNIDALAFPRDPSPCQIRLPGTRIAAPRHGDQILISNTISYNVFNSLLYIYPIPVPRSVHKLIR